jgi:hypothetical protein
MMTGNWRAMQVEDLPVISRIAEVVHPDFPEDDAIFAERLQLCPEGCFVLVLGGKICGYLFSHPWKVLDVPALNTPLGQLPENPGTFYLHDIALLPEARSGGQTGPIIRHLVAQAEMKGFPEFSLVAVNGSQPFWNRNDFVDVDDDRLRQKLLSYDSDARYMVRMLR